VETFNELETEIKALSKAFQDKERAGQTIIRQLSSVQH